ncbi:DUF1932 domain-containing protein [Streptomyces sp. NPDC005921]
MVPGHRLAAVRPAVHLRRPGPVVHARPAALGPGADRRSHLPHRPGGGVPPVPPRRPAPRPGRPRPAGRGARVPGGRCSGLVDGSKRHAVRRTAELRAAADMLDDLGVRPLMTEASRDLLLRLLSEEDAP